MPRAFFLALVYSSSVSSPDSFSFFNSSSLLCSFPVPLSSKVGIVLEAQVVKVSNDATASDTVFFGNFCRVGFASLAASCFSQQSQGRPTKYAAQVPPSRSLKGVCAFFKQTHL